MKYDSDFIEAIRVFRGLLKDARTNADEYLAARQLAESAKEMVAKQAEEIQRLDASPDISEAALNSSLAARTRGVVLEQKLVTIQDSLRTADAVLLELFRGIAARISELAACVLLQYSNAFAGEVSTRYKLPVDISEKRLMEKLAVIGLEQQHLSRWREWKQNYTSSIRFTANTDLRGKRVLLDEVTVTQFLDGCREIEEALQSEIKS